MISGIEWPDHTTYKILNGIEADAFVSIKEIKNGENHIISITPHELMD
jgi:hypothetical protein